MSFTVIILCSKRIGTRETRGGGIGRREGGYAGQ